jgi:hypothetical protein
MWHNLDLDGSAKRAGKILACTGALCSHHFSVKNHATVVYMQPQHEGNVDQVCCDGRPVVWNPVCRRPYLGYLAKLLRNENPIWQSPLVVKHSDHICEAKFHKTKTAKMYINCSLNHDGSNIVIENCQLLFRSGIKKSRRSLRSYPRNEPKQFKCCKGIINSWCQPLLFLVLRTLLSSE